MARAEFMTSLNGLYVLTRAGELGVYDEQNILQVDAELTAALREHNLLMLQRYAASDVADQIRIGIIFPTRQPRAWKTETLFFEQAVIRRLYPVGDMNAPLTTFQKKNQENSFYRGMKILIAARTTESNVSTFFPVLFDRGGTFDLYRDLVGCAKKDSDATTPVVEVLNLAVDLSMAQRDAPAFRALQEKIRTHLIQKERRREDQFTLIDNVRFEKNKLAGGYDGDSRAERRVTLSADDLEQLQALHVHQRHDRVERYLEIPNRPVNPSHLRQFVHFRNINDHCLDVFATRCLTYTAPAGTSLVDHGMTDKWNMYLLEGTVLMETIDGRAYTIEGGSRRAESPLAFLKPRKYKVTSLSKISFLWIHDHLLRAVHDAHGDLHNTPLEAG